MEANRDDLLFPVIVLTDDNFKYNMQWKIYYQFVLYNANNIVFVSSLVYIVFCT